MCSSFTYNMRNNNNNNNNYYYITRSHALIEGLSEIM